MSTGNNIVIQINDNVANTIEPKIRGIATAAVDADAAIASLRTSLGSLNGQNLTALSGNLRSLSTSTTTLKNSTANFGTTALATAVKIDALSLSYANLDAQMITLLATMGAVTAAAKLAGQGATGVGNAAAGAVAGTTRMENALAQFTGRAVGAESGLGMLGGAFARVGVAAGIAGPLIVVGLAVGAIVAAIEVYDKYEESARKLVLVQISLNEQFAHDNDELLEQKENLIGLTQGPLAKYAAELEDIDKKSIGINIANLNKDLDAQKSTLATILAEAPRYIAFLQAVAQGNQVGALFGKGGGIFSPSPVFSIQDTKDFIATQEQIRTSSTNTRQALELDISTVNSKLISLVKQLQDLTPDQQSIQEVSITELGKYLQLEFDQYNLYYGKRKALTAGADGELLSEKRKAASDQLKEFEDEIAQRKQLDDRFTVQQELALRKQQKSGDLTGRDTSGLGSDNGALARRPALPLNQKAVDTGIGQDNQAIIKQNQSLAETVKQFVAAQDASVAYTVALKIGAAQVQEDAKLTKQFAGNDGLGAAIAAVNKSIEVRFTEAASIKEQERLYSEFAQPALNYAAGIDAINKLQKDKIITDAQAVVAQNQITRAYQEAVDPLFTYKEGLADEISLFGKYGESLSVATEVQRVQNELRAKGYSLQQTDVQSLTSYLTLLDRQKEVQSDINKLMLANADATLKLQLNQVALNEAQSKGIITETQYRIATAQNNVALANQKLLMGENATVQDAVVAGIGKYITSYKGLAKGISDAYGQAFATIADGAANSLGRAIVYGEDLGAAFQDVARTAVSELISSFIKLGIQWLITKAIGQSLATAGVSTAIAQAAAVSAAWAPAAAFSSLASFGANAGPAAIGITATVGLSEALAGVSSVLSAFGGGKAQGGLITGPGTGTSDTAGLFALSHGEFIMTAAATARNRSALEAMNSGASAVRANSSVGNGGSQPVRLNVSVVHDGSTNIKVQQVDQNTVRVIAKQEADNAVRAGAGDAAAAAIQNPNSRLSKGIQQHLEAPRKR